MTLGNICQASQAEALDLGISESMKAFFDDAGPSNDLVREVKLWCLLKQLESMLYFYNCGPKTLIISWRST